MLELPSKHYKHASNQTFIKRWYVNIPTGTNNYL